MDIIIRQSVIIKQLTLGQGKLMGTDIAPCLWWPYKYCTTNSWDLTWRPPEINKIPIEAGYPIKREHSPKSMENIVKSPISETPSTQLTLWWGKLMDTGMISYL